MNSSSRELLSTGSSSEVFLSEIVSMMTQETTASPSNQTIICGDTNYSCVCHTKYQPYNPIEAVVLGLFAFPLIIFGLLANVTSVRIFTHRLMSSSPINWYLAVLSVSDTFILIASFFVLTLPRFGEFMMWWRANYISYSVTPVMYGIMNAASTCSVYMTVGVSLHRYIGVCHPYKSVEWLQRKRIIAFIISLLAFALLFNAPKFFEVRSANVCYRESIQYSLPTISLNEFRLSDFYVSYYMGWTSTIIMFIIPFTLLIAVNSVVLSAVKRSRRMHMVSQCSVENDEFSKKSERKERQTSIMLVAIVMLFISCNSWAFICNLMERLGMDEDFIYEFLVMINNFMVLVNASFNICIYMLFSEKYRLLLRHYLRCDWSRQGGELLISSVNG